MNIFQLIKEETKSFGKKTAVAEGDLNISYAELIRSVECVASEFKTKGLKPFHRVGILCENSIDYITLSLALLSLSAVIVPISPDHTEREIDDILDSIDTDCFVFEGDSYRHDDSVRMASCGFLRDAFYLVKRRTRRDLPEEYYKINPAFIRFSSGTTGKSKGVVLSHEAIMERTNHADRGLRILHDDTILWVLSMSFHFVVTILLFLRRAATIVLCNHPFPETLAQGMARHKATVTYAAPFHYNLLSHSDLFPPESFKNIRLAVSTTIKLPDQIASEFYKKFGRELVEAYGIIEVGLPFINLSSDSSKRSSVGQALPGYEVKVSESDQDGVGEIFVRGEGMLDAYFSPWQNSEEILEDGWFKTGDLGRMDEERFLTIVGRKKLLINFAGMKVFPLEVEGVINRFPGVKESYVYGEDHPRYGQLPMAKVVPEVEYHDTLNLYDLKRYCYQNLAQYKVPKDFEIFHEIPKTKSGKIQRRSFRQDLKNRQNK